MMTGAVAGRCWRPPESSATGRSAMPQGAADFARGAVAPSGGTVLATVEDDPQVQGVPRFAGEELFQVALGLGDIFRLAEFPAAREPVDVGVDREGGHPEGLGHDDRRGFMADAGERLEFLEGPGHLPSVTPRDQAGQFLNGPGLLRA